VNPDTSSSTSTGSAEKVAPQSAPADPKKKGEQSAEVAKAKDVLAQAQAQLDVLKRELSLDSDNFFSNPDYSHDANGKAKLDELQKMIGDKQISVRRSQTATRRSDERTRNFAGGGQTPAPPKN